MTGVLSIVGLGAATSMTIGWGEIGNVAGIAITGTNLFICGLIGLLVTALIVVITEYYTGTGKRFVSIAQASVAAAAQTSSRALLFRWDRRRCRPSSSSAASSPPTSLPACSARRSPSPPCSALPA